MSAARLLAAALCTASLAACAGSARPQYSEAPAQVVETSGATGQLITGNYDGVNYLAQTAVRAYPADGKLGVCALYRVLAFEDIRRKFVDSVQDEKSFMTIRGSDDTKVTLNTAFMTVIFKQTPLSGKPQQDVAKFDKDKAEGGCVVTDYPWKDSFANAKAELRLVRRVIR